MTDEQMLWEAMDECWHEPDSEYAVGKWRTLNYPFDHGMVMQKCKKCGRILSTSEQEYLSNPDFTSGDILWRVLQYMMRREDWGKFLNHAAEEFYLFQVDWSLGDFMRWLLSDPARFIHLCADWCREKEKGE